MAEKGEYRFEIQDLTPLTLSLRRLKDYVEPLIDLFGYGDNVHLIRVDEGSAAPCLIADSKIITTLERRFLSIKTGSGPKVAYRAAERINDLLAEDRTSGQLRSLYSGIVIEFPGIGRAIDA